MILLLVRVSPQSGDLFAVYIVVANVVNERSGCVGNLWSGSGFVDIDFTSIEDVDRAVFSLRVLTEAKITGTVYGLLSLFSSEDVSAQNQVKASVQRKIRQSIADEYPGLELVLDDLLPKKSPLIVAKWDKCLGGRTGVWDGSVHTDPNIMKKFQVDKGAIKYVLAGANIMCPGLTSPGGALNDEVMEETPVAITAEGKQHALAIGFTKMSAKDIRAINKGIGVDNMHYLNDGLWKHLDEEKGCPHKFEDLMHSTYATGLHDKECTLSFTEISHLCQSSCGCEGCLEVEGHAASVVIETLTQCPLSKGLTESKMCATCVGNGGISELGNEMERRPHVQWIKLEKWAVFHALWIEMQEAKDGHWIGGMPNFSSSNHSR
ncbi:hypothetical protein ACLOJK_026256 [Asimina triloba]